ncbi:Eco57I restriction-modification methylase domain-containing protein [Lancefieldella rimae]
MGSIKDAKPNSFQKVLDSAAYQTNLEDVVSAILRKCNRDDTESTIASVFENELYHFIRVQFSIDIKFNKEIGKRNLRHAFQGRMDAVSNGLVIEYKRQTKLAAQADQESAVDQISDYLQQLYSQGKLNNGVLTDGYRVCFFYWTNGQLSHSGFTTIGPASVDKIVRFLIGSEEKLFSSNNILEDFTLQNKKNPSYLLSQVLFTAIRDNATNRSSMLYEEWLSLFHLSEMDKGKNKDIAARRKVLGEYFNWKLDDNDLDHKALFALQTTYALVIKLIACKVIGKLAYDDNIQYFSDLANVGSEQLLDFLVKLEDGYVFKAGGVRNLLEGDFFSWYASAEQWCPAISTPIKDIIAQIEIYATVSNSRVETVDVFKDLYMDFIPQEVRHSLGEYYTPDWLVDHVVESAISKCNRKEDWRGIDPCCGSGVFVLKMVDKIIASRTSEELSEGERKSLLNEVLTRVVGIDINPLSALTSRVNFFLSIAEFIQPTDEIEIPIYVGDSAVMPKIENLNGIDCYTYVVKTAKREIKTILPRSFVESHDFLKAMNSVQTYVKSDSSELLYESLVGKIIQSDLNTEVEAAIKNFADDLVYLHQNNWDGIWVRIVSNYMLIARVSDRDIIVGNPPWVKWEYLPEEYAKKLKSACFEREMFSGQSYMGAISLNICAAIAIMTASAWLTSDGVLAFLMPTNLLTQDSYEGFRNFKLTTPHKGDRLYLQEVECWPKSGLFSKSSVEPCATFYYKSNHVDYTKGLPVYTFKKKRGSTLDGLIKWQDASKCLNRNQGIAVQIDTNRTGYTLISSDVRSYIEKFQAIVGSSAYKGRTGVEFVPEEVTFLEATKSSPQKDVWFFKGKKMKRSIHKVATSEEFMLETTFIKPLIKGPNISDFHIKDTDDYCLFPYKDGETYCCSVKNMLSIAPKTVEYLSSKRDLFNRQSERSKSLTRGSEFYALSKVGPYTYNKNMVVIRDNVRMCGSVVKPRKTAWGQTIMSVPAKHAAIISTHADEKETPITEEEAYYLAGIFNTPLIREWYKSTFSDRSYSIRFNFKIPLYNASDNQCRQIAELSKRGHELAAEGKPVDAIESQIEELYLALCGYQPADQK